MPPAATASRSDAHARAARAVEAYNAMWGGTLVAALDPERVDRMVSLEEAIAAATLETPDEADAADDEDASQPSVPASPVPSPSPADKRAGKQPMRSGSSSHEAAVAAAGELAPVTKKRRTPSPAEAANAEDDAEASDGSEDTDVGDLVWSGTVVVEEDEDEPAEPSVVLQPTAEAPAKAPPAKAAKAPPAKGAKAPPAKAGKDAKAAKAAKAKRRDPQSQNARPRVVNDDCDHAPARPKVTPEARHGTSLLDQLMPVRPASQGGKPTREQRLAVGRRAAPDTVRGVLGGAAPAADHARGPRAAQLEALFAASQIPGATEAHEAKHVFRGEEQMETAAEKRQERVKQAAAIARASVEFHAQTPRRRGVGA